MNKYLAECWEGAKSLWQHYWLGILAIVSVIAALGYHKIMIDLLINAANKSFGIANKKADDLKTKETAEVADATKLTQQVADLKAQEASNVVDENWDQK